MAFTMLTNPEALLLVIKGLLVNVLAHQCKFGRFTTSVNIVSAVFYKVHKKECHLDLARTSPQGTVCFQIFGKDSPKKIKTKKKRKQKTELPSYLPFWSLFIPPGFIGPWRGVKT